MFNINTPLNVVPEYNPVDFDEFLRNSPLKGLGVVFINAGRKYTINPLFLMCLAILESGWGRSNYAVNRNNLYGYMAYDSNPDKAGYFSSKEACIVFIACFLANSYLTPTTKLLYELPNGQRAWIGQWWGGEPTAHGVFVHYSSAHDAEAFSIVTLMNQFLQTIYPMEGGEIVLASAPVPAPVTVTLEKYTVKSGQSLSSIAQEVYGNWTRCYDIAAANNIPAPYVIHPGQVLVLPGRGVAATPDAPAPREYVVRPGDSLSVIAYRWYKDGSRASWMRIYEANRAKIGTNPDAIHVGDVLRIP